MRGEGYSVYRLIGWLVMVATCVGCGGGDPPGANREPADRRAGQGIGPGEVTVRVITYNSDAMHSSATGPEGMVYHPDWFDSAICEIVTPQSHAGERLQIWGWNRQTPVAPALREPGATVRLRCDLGRQAAAPWESGPTGFGQWEVELLTTP